MNIQEEVRRFIESNFVLGRVALGPDDSLLEAGVVDSTGVLELIAFIEETYGFELSEEEIVPENLDSIAKIAAFVARKHTPEVREELREEAR